MLHGTRENIRLCKKSEKLVHNRATNKRRRGIIKNLYDDNENVVCIYDEESKIGVKQSCILLSTVYSMAVHGVMKEGKRSCWLIGKWKKQK